MIVRSRGKAAVFGFALMVGMAAAGCGGGATGPSTAAHAKEPASLTCPVLRGVPGRDLAVLFGIDVTLAGKITRTMTLLAELERSAKALDTESREVCDAIARDLEEGGASAASGGHPCELAVQRLAALRRALGGFSVSVSDVACGIPRDSIARCAGECLTGRADVVSAVECSAPDRCGFDFALPDASPQCATQCGARAIRDVRCTATVDFQVAGGVELTLERVEALRRDLPRLVTLGASMGPRAIELGAQVKALVDDLAESIDALTANAPDRSTGSESKPLLDRRVVVGAVLAGCVAPALADTLRASASLQGSVSGAVQLHAAFLGR